MRIGNVLWYQVRVVGIGKAAGDSSWTTETVGLDTIAPERSRQDQKTHKHYSRIIREWYMTSCYLNLILHYVFILCNPQLKKMCRLKIGGKNQ